MEVKSGYKQTEIGVIPSDWDIKLIDNLTSRVGDGIHSTPHYCSSGNYYFINGNNLKNGQVITDELTKKVDFNEFQKHIRDINDSTILLSINGTIGNVAYYKNEKVVLGKSAAYINIKKQVSKEYLFHKLQTSNVQLFFHNNLTGSTIKNLGLGTIRNTPLSIPPTLKEQTAIATALSDTDAWINSLEQLLTKKRQIKQGAMQELLQPKDGWEVKKLGEIGKPYGGLSGKAKDDFYKGGYPYIPFMNIMSNPIIDTNYVDYVNIKQGEIQNKAQKFDLFFNGSSETPEEVGMCSVLLEDVPNLFLNSFCFGYRLFKEQNIDALYLSYFFRSDEGRNLFYAMAQGATRYNLSKGNFLKLEIKVPKPEDQTRIATILSDMDEEIGQLESKLEKTKQLKQGMMQELLTGRIRLV